MDKKKQPQQSQNPPGEEKAMTPEPQSENPNYKAADKFLDKVVIVTGGDSGIGKATSLAFAKEGADVAIIYNEADEDANKTKERIEEIGRKCLLVKGDLKQKSFCNAAVNKIIAEFKHIDVLINNAGKQYVQQDFENISEEQLQDTFQTNIYSMFYLTQAVVPYLKKGSAIVNTTSVTAYQGRKQLIDYSSTKGAILTFTRSLAQNLVEKGIRVNAVAPGPIWTPLIPSTFPPEKVEKFGTDTPMKRAGQPYEVATAFIYLASNDASYITGQTIHVNGGHSVNG